MTRLPLTLVGLLGMVLLQGATRPLTEPAALGWVNWNTSQVQAVGTGQLTTEGDFVTQRLLGRQSATRNAFPALLKALRSLRLRPNLTLGAYVDQHPELSLPVEALVQGQKRLGIPRYFADGSVEVDLQVSLFDDQGVARLLSGKELLTSPLAQYAEPISTPDPLKEHTGLILKAVGLGLKPALLPMISGPQGRLYPMTAPESGLPQFVHYTHDLKQAHLNTAVVGSNPLVLEASKATGNPWATDILLNREAARILMQANQASRFLEAFKVVVVL